MIVFGRFDWVIHVDTVKGFRVYLIKHVLLGDDAYLSNDKLVAQGLVSATPLEIPDFTGLSKLLPWPGGNVPLKIAPGLAIVNVGPCVYVLSEYVANDIVQSAYPTAVDIEYAEFDYEWQFDYAWDSQFVAKKNWPVIFSHNSTFPNNPPKTLGNFTKDTMPSHFLLAIGSKTAIHPSGACSMRMPTKLRLKVGPSNGLFPAVGLGAAYSVANVTAEYKNSKVPIFQIDAPPAAGGQASQVDLKVAGDQALLCVRFGTSVAPEAVTFKGKPSGFPLMNWCPALVNVEVVGWFGN